MYYLQIKRHFSDKDVFIAHTSHAWITDNPHSTQPHRYQQRFRVNVWAGIVNEILINPYLRPTRLNGESYLIFLEQLLPELLQDVPIANRIRM